MLRIQHTRKLFFTLFSYFLLQSPVAMAKCMSAQMDNGDGVVISEITGLMWSQCLFELSGTDCHQGQIESHDWVGALNSARGSEYAGFRNWRLPKIEEIEALMLHCTEMSIYFPEMVGGVIWSASANLDYATDAWAFNLTEMKREVVGRDQPVTILLVRNIE